MYTITNNKMEIKHFSDKCGVYFEMRAPGGLYVSKAYTEITNYPPKWLIDALNLQNRHLIYFCNFVTKQMFRGKGYGRKLLQDVKKYYKNCVVYLGVGSYGVLTNEQLVKFYESEGFKIIEEAKKYVSYPMMAIEL